MARIADRHTFARWLPGSYLNSRVLSGLAPRDRATGRAENKAMIEVFKILHHMYDSSVAPELIRNTSASRGNKYKLLNHTFHYNFRKFSFAARISVCVSVWVPYKKEDIEVLEKVQKKATKITPELRHLPYTERLKACKLPTLRFRQVRGDNDRNV